MPMEVISGMKTDEEMSTREHAAYPFVLAAYEELTHAEQILFHGGFNDRDKAVKIGEAIALLRGTFEISE